MSLFKTSCSPNASQQSIWASQGGAAEAIARLSLGKIRAVLVGIPWARVTIQTRFMSLLRASCSPNASQQSIWASQGRAAEGSELQSFCDHCTGTIFLRFPEPGGIYQKQAFLVYSCLAAVWLSFLLAMDQASTITCFCWRPKIFCWLESAEHEAVQVVTLQSVQFSSVVQSQDLPNPQEIRRETFDMCANITGDRIKGMRQDVKSEPKYFKSTNHSKGWLLAGDNRSLI